MTASGQTRHFIAGWLLPRIGFVLVGGIAAEIVNAVIGAVILLLVIGSALSPVHPQERPLSYAIDKAGSLARR